MNSILRSAQFGAIALVAALVVAIFVLVDTAAAAQPTLKEVIGGKDKEKQVKKKAEQKPKPEQKKAPPGGARMNGEESPPKL